MPEATPTKTKQFAVYSKSACQQCLATYRKLDKEGLEYEKLDGTTPEAVAHLKSLGYQQLPVVLYGGEHWSGYRPDLIQQIAASQQ